MTTRPAFDELLARARAGDARAQYVVSAVLARAGRRAEADGWLGAAAKQGEPDALYTIATRLMRTRAGCAEAAPMLARAATHGAAAAARALAVLEMEGVGVDRDEDAARRRVLALAASGDAPARRDLAGLLILRQADDPDADALLAGAAAADPVASVVYGARLAAGRSGVDPLRAATALESFAAQGFEPAVEMRRRLSGAEGHGPAAAAVELDYAAIAEKLRTPPSASAATAISLVAAIGAVRHVAAAPAEIAAYVVAAAAPWLAPSTVEGPDGRTARHPTRTSQTATLGPVDLDLTLVEVGRLMARHAGVTSGQGEFLSVLRYAPGEEYKPHYDWLPDGPERDRGGQRVATTLFYLNDSYDGGETHFLRAGVSVKGRAGDMVVFRNAAADGSLLTDSYHAGAPVTAGVKWLATRWFRQGAYQF